MATAQEIGTWIDALGRRLTECVKEIGEIEAEVMAEDNGITRVERRGLQIRLKMIRTEAASAVKS